MSDTRHQRFEIDLDEIERQLRASVDAMPAPRPVASVAPAPGPAPAAPKKADPLAELARIVGQDDPFKSILGSSGVAPPVADVPVVPARSAAAAPALTAEEDGILHGDRPAPVEARPAGAPPYDPVVDHYGSHDDAIAEDDIQPLRPRRSRRGLAVLVSVLALGAVGAAGAIAYRNSGSGFSFSGSGQPPLIQADNAPLKVQPENPGGMEIPNQNKQIYERGTADGRSRVVDRQEQPLDVREAVRATPEPQIPIAAAPVAPELPPSAPGPGPAPGAGAAPNAVASALGEPRRVRTVSVRPDGSTILPGQPVAIPSAPSYVPSADLPPPIPVQTTTIPANPPAPVAPAVQPAPTVAAAAPAAPAASDGATPATPPAPVTVLPPQRPRIDTRTAAATPAAPSAPEPATDASGAPLPIGARPRPPARNAAAPQPAVAPEDAVAAPATTAAAPASGRGSFTVQIASRPSEQEARQTYDQLSEQYATDLGGKPASLTRAQVSGRTVYRVRVGPLTREAANTLCQRLKSSGGACTVVAN